MTDGLVSVIVPVFNIDKYLDRCIMSIVQQTYQNLEIILIDDGSTDNSGIICDSWALRDQRIVVKHIMNSGVSVARNTALDMIHGEYVAFVDADDWIDLDMYECMVKAIQESKADICAGGYVLSTDKNKAIQLKYKTKNYDRKEVILMVFAPNRNTKMGWELCDKLFRVNLFKTCRLRNGCVCAEDKLMFWQIMKKANKICHLALYKYHYFMRHDSAIHKITINHILDDVSVAEFIYKDSFNEDESIREAVQLRCYMTIISTIRKLMLLNNDSVDKEEYIERYVKTIRKNLVHILVSNCDFAYKLGAIYAVIPYSCKLACLSLIKRFRTRADMV